MIELDKKDYPSRIDGENGSYAQLLPSTKNYMLTQPMGEYMVTRVPFPAMTESGEIRFKSMPQTDGHTYEIVWNKSGLIVYKDKHND